MTEGGQPIFRKDDRIRPILQTDGEVLQGRDGDGEPHDPSGMGRHQCLQRTPTNSDRYRTPQPIRRQQGDEETSPSEVRTSMESIQLRDHANNHSLPPTLPRLNF